MHARGRAVVLCLLAGRAEAQSCEPHDAHDATHVTCFPACSFLSTGHACQLCKCKACAACKRAAAASPAPPPPRPYWWPAPEDNEDSGGSVDDFEEGVEYTEDEERKDEGEQGEFDIKALLGIFAGQPPPSKANLRTCRLHRRPPSQRRRRAVCHVSLFGKGSAST